MLQKRFIKMPHGCMAKARALGVWGESLLFFKLKSYNTEGSFRKSSVKTVARSLDLGVSTLRQGLSKLVSLGLVRRDSFCYSLVSYDKMYSFLGYDMTPQTRGRLGSFKIFKIPVDKVPVLLEEYCTAEIDFNLKRQRYAVIAKQRKSKKGDSESHTHKSIITTNFLLAKDGEVFNRDITITCSGVSRLLGLSSSFSGHKILNRLEEYGSIQVQKRSEFVRMLKPFEKFKQTSGYFIEDGVVVKRVSSKVSVIAA